MRHVLVLVSMSMQPYPEKIWKTWPAKQTLTEMPCLQMRQLDRYLPGLPVRSHIKPNASPNSTITLTRPSLTVTLSLPNRSPNPMPKTNLT